MLTTFQKIFLLSKAYGQSNFQEQLPIQGREWPSGWFTQRLAQVREMRKERKGDE